MSYDLAIIGGGTGGYTAAIRAAKNGLNVLLIEKEQLGGTCLHKGCIPTKAMLESSGLFHRMAQADEFGIEWTEKPVFSVEKMMERKNKIVTQLHQGIQYLMRKNKIALEKGTGRIIDRSGEFFKVEIQKSDDSLHVQAKAIILATGSVPVVPSSIACQDGLIVTSDHMMSMKSLPKKAAILGGGVIGAEFATILHELGVEVSIIEQQDRLLPLEDEEISKELTRLMKRKGIRLHLQSRLDLAGIQTTSAGVTLPIQSPATNQVLTEEADLLLLAVGRKNNVAGLGLEELGIDVSKGFVPVDSHQETSVKGVYAIGDIAGSFQLAHVASHQAIIAVDRIRGEEAEPYIPEYVPRCVYTNPQVASIGLTEKEAVERGLDIRIGKFPFKGIGKALIHGETDGFVKMVSDAKTDRLLGVHMVGPDVSELIGEQALGLLLEATAWEVSSAIHPHPTLVEILGEAALAVEGQEING